LQTRHTVDRGDIDTYFVIYRQLRHLYYNNNCMLYTATSYFCVSQCSATTLFRWVGRVYNFMMWNFLKIFPAKNIEIDWFYTELFKT